MSRIVRNDPYLTREDTGADQGRSPAIQHYEKQDGSDGATSNTVFTLSKPYVQGSNTLMVFINGQKAELLVSASNETEYEETSSSTITFGASLLDTDVVEFMIVGTYFIQDTDIYVTKSLEKNPNIIINGDFDIWQRGTSFAAIASSTFTADRFSYQFNISSVHTLTRNTSVPTFAESGHTSNYSLRLDVTTADAAIADNELNIIRYVVEGHDAAAIYGKSATLSFWVKATKTGTHCVSFTTDIATARSYVAEYTISAADTWEKKTITVLFNDSVGTWDTTTGKGIKIHFGLAVGADYQTTADSWQTGAFLGTSNQVNVLDSTDNDFSLSQVKLEVGQIATPFVPRPFAEELALCQRYFESSYNQGVPPGTATADAQRLKWASYVSIYIRSKFSSEKRAVGTGYVYSPISGTVGTFYDWSATADDNTDVSVAVSTSGIECKNSSVTDNHLYGVHWAVDAEL